MAQCKHEYSYLGRGEYGCDNCGYIIDSESYRAIQHELEIADLQAQVARLEEVNEAQAICAEEFATTNAENAALKAQVGALINQVIECQDALHTVNSKVWNKPRTKDWWKQWAEAKAKE